MMATKRHKAKTKVGTVRESNSPYETFKRITFDPNLMGGQACIRGMRIPVSLIVNLVANGMTSRKILDEYPDLELEDVTEALHYAAWLTKESVHVASR